MTPEERYAARRGQKIVSPHAVEEVYCPYSSTGECDDDCQSTEACTKEEDEDD